MPLTRVVHRNSSGQRRAAPDATLAAVAGGQHSLVTATQLRQVGVDHDATDYRLRVGRLHLIHRGVYAVGHPELTPEGRFLAAVLALGDGAVLSHLPAAILWQILRKLWLPDDSDIDVTTPRRLKPRPGIRPHSAPTLKPADWTRFKGIPVTTPARTLLDVATLLPARTFRRAVHEAEVQRRVNHRQLRAQIAGRGTRSAAVLRAVIDEGPAPTRSGLEDDALDLLREHGFLRPETNARVEGFEVDLFYADHRLVIEVDSERYHGTAYARRNDARKQARLEAAGYRVIRLDEHDVNVARELTARRLRQAMAEQATQLSRRACQTGAP